MTTGDEISVLTELSKLDDDAEIEVGVTLMDMLDEDVTVGLITEVVLILELLVEDIDIELELFEVIVTTQSDMDAYVVAQSTLGPELTVGVAKPPISAIAAPILAGGQ
jgi:hypothetical protein